MMHDAGCMVQGDWYDRRVYTEVTQIPALFYQLSPAQWYEMRNISVLLIEIPHSSILRRLRKGIFHKILI